MIGIASGFQLFKPACPIFHEFLIRKLEGELGIPLFRRDTKNVQLTEAGKKFTEEAINVVESYRRLENTCGELNNMAFKGTINVGTSVFTLPNTASGVSMFMSKYPNTMLNIVEGWD